MEYTIAEVAQKLSVSSETVLIWIRKKRFTNVISGGLKKKEYFITEDALNEFIKNNEQLILYYQDMIPNGYIKSEELVNRFNVTHTKILHWIRQGRFKDAKKIDKGRGRTGFYIIPETSVVSYEKLINDLEDNYVTTGLAAKMLEVGRSTIGNWVENGQLKGALIWYKTMYIPIQSINYLKNALNTYTMNLTEAAKRLMISRKTVKRYINSGKLKAIHLNNQILFSPKDVEEFRKVHKNILSSSYKKKTTKEILESLPQGYYTVSEVAKKLGVPDNKVRNLIYGGYIQNIKQCVLNGKVRNIISGKALADYIQIQEKIDKSMTTSQAAAYLGISVYNTVSGMVKLGYFPNAFRFKKNYYIPVEDLDEYKRLKATGGLYIHRKSTSKESTTKEKSKINVLSKKELINDLLETIKTIDTPNHLIQTKKLYIKYAQIRIKALNGRQRTLISECIRIRKTFEKIILDLPKECFLLDENGIESLLTDERIAITHRTLFNWFLSYAFQELNMERKRDFVFTQKQRKLNDDKEIYSPEIYLAYVQYVKRTELHKKEALKNPYYANMWLFTIMHLIDAWRASDIVTELPPIEIETIGITHLDWFLDKQLTTTQAQTIINQVYVKTRHITASKNNALLTFIVPLNMLIPTATAMVLCELHRRKSEDQFLLQTLVTTNLSARNPNKKHLSFFKFNSELSQFKSLVMNRSTMTYLFYSITEDAEDTDLALYYTQQIRSHSSEDSTAVYVQATNQDGSINRVSITLFNRGHFGWLFNHLIQLVMNENQGYQKLEERTQSIVALKNEFSPSQLENWAAFLNRVQGKREPIIRWLSGQNKNEIKRLIQRILRSENPSRTDHGQCLSFPSCVKPNLRSCYYCEHFIPQTYLLIHVKHEFYRLIESIKNSNHEAIVIRDSEFLNYILLLINEAIAVYGTSYVQSFIDLDHVRKLMINVKDKFLLTGKG
ncbi:MAG TPA: helix-turn-helix domain-containing protein [Bacillus sp. (in: firmicutes)]|uniref:helix-turn-helix domain-containing protein n=1 Tax=Bacillus litorisediminis TaxID=2922713 RepID=UPI001FAEC318|nr:helix-turn-helix domain-containing protein [Bacillus litorisediminis]HWO78638.1 helix-turn-helix domain-containing protein [Bacillus sp. (in: firmicutes)]